MRSRSLIALTAAALVAGVAHADIVDTISLGYQSGASLDGTLVLSNDLSSVLSLTGTLSGYDPTMFGPSPGSTDPISAPFPFNLASVYGYGPSTYFAVISDSSYNWLDFGYTYNSSGIDFSTVSNDVSGSDSLVSASVRAVPEPGTLVLLAVGLFGLAATHRRWTLNAARG